MKSFFTNLHFPIISDTCSQKRDAGICPGNVPRFYFDKTYGRCQLFSYGGCGGNSNNFETIDECVAHCGGPREDVFLVSNLQGEYFLRENTQCISQCGIFKIFLSFRFYMKSILENLKVVKIPFWPIS